MTNIQTALSIATKLLEKTSDSAALDAEVLLCHALNKPKSHLRAWPEKILKTQNKEQFFLLVTQRHQGIPIAYIIGNREFWSRDFKVNKDVLIPRPDTELLIELSLDSLTDTQNANIIDLGTGSGIIAITLAAERADLNIIATDLSTQALSIAKQNAVAHHTKNIQFIQSNWFNKIPDSKFDLIISNPPYIANNDLHLSQGDVRFEPKSALTAEDRGLSDIKKISTQAHNFLTPTGTLLIEHGYNQHEAVQAIFKSFNYHNIKTHPDLSGNPRVTTGQWKIK